jgi:CcmD family protein
MTYMVAAYMVIWFATFAFVFSIRQRQRGLERDIATLKEVAQGKDSK